MYLYTLPLVFLVAICLYSFSSIAKPSPNVVIPQGKHKKTRLPRMVRNINLHSFEVTFTESCRYELGNDNQNDSNKIGGYSVGHHHKNSIRLGWNYNPQKGLIILRDYRYVNGVRSFKKIGELPIGEKVYIEISPEPTYLKTKDCRAIHISNQALGKGFGYKVNPYFGGQEVAPHKIEILYENEIFEK